MKKSFQVLALFVLILSFTSFRNNDTVVIATGYQPQIAVDSKGIIRIVYGVKDQIFCSTSTNNGQSFSQPALVGQIAEMHLGMTRGPQVASSAHYTVVAAMDKQGDIHSFQLDHATGQWTKKAFINDERGAAPEGLMNIAADDKDHFYAVWLDNRTNDKNKIYFSSAGKSGKWTANKQIYQSPDEHVCECCKPSIAVHGEKVALMFRNWLNGARDLYWMQSVNGGATFSTAKKLGTGTWKLNACPMDGGGITINNDGTTHTAWRREDVVYYCKPGETEIAIAKGKICGLASSKNQVWITLQDKNEVKVVNAQNKEERVIGKGGFLKAVILSDKKLLCVWEQEGQVQARVI